MNATGIIAEYNPFHNGHAYHIAKAKAITNQPIIVVMSGNFVQRGEPAIFEKFMRARTAVQCGADLVLELPLLFANSSAEYFASGAVRLLAQCAVVSHIVCGAENPDIIHRECSFNAACFHQALASGVSYATAMAKAHDDNADFKPNNILALEYHRAIKRYAPDITLLPIQRVGNDYSHPELTGALSSATALRHALREEQLHKLAQCMPNTAYQNTLDYLASHKQATLESFWPVVSYKLRLLTAARLREYGLTEGLENAFIQHNYSSNSLAELIYKVKSRRYTYTRLQRNIIDIVLEVNYTDKHAAFDAGPAYLRPLAWNAAGLNMFKYIAKKTSLPALTSAAKALRSSELSCEAKRSLIYDITATKIHSQLSGGGALADYHVNYAAQCF